MQKQEFLIGIRAQEGQVESGLGDQDDEQQKNPDRQQNDDPLATRPLVGNASWIRSGHSIYSPGTATSLNYGRAERAYIIAGETEAEPKGTSAAVPTLQVAGRTHCRACLSASRVAESCVGQALLT